VCTVRNVNTGKCTVSLELDRAGLDNRIARDRLQFFLVFNYVVIIMLFKLSLVQQEGSENEAWFKLV